MLTFAQAKEIVAQMQAANVPDNAEFAVRMLNGEKLELQRSFVVVGKNSEYNLDASEHWAEQVSEPNLALLKQA